MTLESGPLKDGRMKKSRFSEEQIIGILKEQEAGVPVAELCCKHGNERCELLHLEGQVRRLEVSETRRPRGRGPRTPS
jgi:putative transposase